MSSELAELCERVEKLETERAAAGERLELIAFAIAPQLEKAEQARGRARADAEDRKRRNQDAVTWREKLIEFLDANCVAVPIPDFDKEYPINVPRPNRNENSLGFDDLMDAVFHANGGKSPLATMTGGDVTASVTQFAERRGGRRATHVSGVRWFGIALRNSKLGRAASNAGDAAPA